MDITLTALQYTRALYLGMKDSLLCPYLSAFALRQQLHVR